MTRLPLLARLSAIPPTRWRLTFLAALVVLLGVSTVQHIQKTRKLSRLGTQTKTAFLRWRTQILGEETPGRGAIPGLKRGDDVYKLYNYPNPPIMALILWPMAELPATVGALVWFFLKVGMTVALFVWAFRLCESRGPPIPAWAKALTIVLSLHPILGDLSHGNVNIFIAFLVFGALEAYRRGYDIAAGLTLALAIACKVTPALFLPYFVWKRARKLVVVCLAGLGLWLFVVPGAVLGWQHNVTLLNSWFNGMVKPFLVDGKVTSEHANQSIPGVVFRLLTRQPSEIAYDDEDRPMPAEFHNFVDIGPGAARAVIRGFQAAFVLAVVLLCRPRGARQGLPFAAECSFILLGMLLFSERTWKHHAVTLVLPYAVLTAFLTTHPLSLPMRRYVIATLIGAGVLTLGPSALPEEAQDLAQTYGAYTLAYLALAVGMCVVMFSVRRETQSSAAAPACSTAARGEPALTSTSAQSPSCSPHQPG
jgi:hypothetical protein